MDNRLVCVRLAVDETFGGGRSVSSDALGVAFRSELHLISGSERVFNVALFREEHLKRKV